MAQKREVQEIQIEVTTELRCNKCGKSYNVEDDNVDIHSFIVNAYGINTSLSKDNAYTFELCESCVVQFFDTLTISPDKVDFGDMGIDLNQLNL